MIRQKKPLRVLLPLAAMGDIAFLLIIFFMLTASFMKEGNVPLEPPRSADLAEVEPSQISLSVDAADIVRLQGVEVSVQQLPAALEVLLQDRKNRTVRIRMHKDVKRQIFLPVIAAVSAAGGQHEFIGDPEKP